MAQTLPTTTLTPPKSLPTAGAPTPTTEKAEVYGGGTPARVLSICLINPKFDPSYWGFEYALPMYPGDRRSTMLAGALPTLAGLADGHQIYLMDESVEKIDWARLSSFDIVGVTGMNVQSKRMKEILVRLKDIDTFVAVGGPYASVKEDFFEGLCDVIFVGEAEETWTGFLADYAAGRPFQKRYEQTEKTNMEMVPRPRYDLLKAQRYASGALQFSRGCPFSCEFCDIIVIYGRRPRLKRPDQVLTELEDMRKAGFHLVMLVDDNFVGNKKKAKELLREIIKWQEKTSYPVRINTQASINLADDPEMLDLMYQANFRSVFIGIETPRMASLKETKKLQNTRGDSLEAKLSRIQNAGLDISAGFIVGFDNDDKLIFEDQYNFIQNNGVLLAMVGMLGAIPTTPLYKRLEEEGRLFLEDPNCNFEPKQMTRDELKEGYWDLVEKLYTPEAFMERYLHSFKYPEYHKRRAEMCDKAHEGKFIPTLGFGVIMTWNLFWTLIKDRSFMRLAPAYLRYYRKARKYRKDVIGFAQFANRCVTHFHFFRFTREAREGKLRTYNSG
jgi:radical SAM superfamily enzyme YgiQ (UPF0313 family)